MAGQAIVTIVIVAVAYAILLGVRNRGYTRRRSWTSGTSEQDSGTPWNPDAPDGGQGYHHHHDGNAGGHHHDWGSSGGGGDSGGHHHG